MFSYKEESCILGKNAQIQDSQKEESNPCKDFITLIMVVYKNFAFVGVPIIFEIAKERKINVLFKNTAVDIDMLLSISDEFIADINKQWPLFIIGTADNFETISINVGYEGNNIVVKKKSMSGKEVNIIMDVCFQIICPDYETASNFLHLLNSLNWTGGVTVYEWKDINFLSQNRIISEEIKGYFFYGNLQEQVTIDDCLDSLNFLNKITLWIEFLKYGVPPLELEWLVNRIFTGKFYNHLEWEMALYKAIELLDFTLIVKKNLFQIFDSNGKRIYFSVEHNNFGEKALMKILFPLN